MLPASACCRLLAKNHLRACVPLLCYTREYFWLLSLQKHLYLISLAAATMNNTLNEQSLGTRYLFM